MSLGTCRTSQRGREGGREGGGCLLRARWGYCCSGSGTERKGSLQPLFSAPLQASRPSSTCRATRLRCSTWRHSWTRQCGRRQKDSGRECGAPAIEISCDFSGLEVCVDVGPHVERRAAARRRPVHALRHQRVSTPQLEGSHWRRIAAAQLTRRSAGLSSGRSLRQSREW